MNEILVVVDSSQTSSHIISFAVDIAKKMNIYITLVWINDYNGNNLDSDKLIINDKFDEIVNSFSEILDKSFFELRIITRNPSIELVKLINDLEIDMVFIKKYKAKNAFNRMFNDYPLQVQAQVECPIMIFPIEYVYKGVASVVVPIDSNKNTQQKIPLATILSKKFDIGISAMFFIDNRDKVGSLEQKKQCIDYMDRYNVSKKEYTDVNSKINTESIINVNDKPNNSIIIIMKNNLGDSAFKKYTFTQRLIIESDIPVISVPIYKTKLVRSRKYFKL